MARWPVVLSYLAFQVAVLGFRNPAAGRQVTIRPRDDPGKLILLGGPGYL